MNAPVKRHPQHITAMSQSYFFNKPIWDKPVATYPIKEWLDEAQEHVIIGQRLGLETNLDYRQLLPYLIPTQLCKDGVTRYYPYQRGSGVGEQRLAGKVSVGYGGHVDGKDVIYSPESVLDLKLTILGAAMRERYEELEVVDEEQKALWTAMAPSFSNQFIASSLNDTDRVHLGIIMLLQCPEGMELNCKEDELTSLPMMTAEELLDSDYDLENWTRLYLQNVNDEVDTGPVIDEDLTGFGNERALHDPLTPVIALVTRTRLDECLAVVWAAFNKGEDVKTLPEYLSVAYYVQINKGKPDFVNLAALLVEAVSYPALGENYHTHIKNAATEYLESRFSPDEWIVFAAGGKTLQADEVDVKAFDECLAVLQATIDLKKEIFETSINFDEYARKLAVVVARLEAVPSNSYSEEVAYVTGQMVRAHSLQFEQLGDNLTDTNMAVRVFLECNLEMHQGIWEEATKKCDLIFKPFEEVIEHLAEAMPELVEKVKRQIIDADF